MVVGGFVKFTLETKFQTRERNSKVDTATSRCLFCEILAWIFVCGSQRYQSEEVLRGVLKAFRIVFCGLACRGVRSGIQTFGSKP